MPFTNGDFETGDLTGWTKGEYNAVVAVSADAKRTGTYGCSITVTTTDAGDGSGTVSQSISTDFGTLRFDYKIAALADPPATAVWLGVSVSAHDESHNVQDVEVYAAQISSAGDWTTLSITKAECEAAFPAGWHWIETGNTTVTVICQVQ
jgi:hypothetical protein